MLPTRTFKFPKHSPPSYSNPPGSVYAIPDADVKDNKWADHGNYEALENEDSEDVIAAHEDHEQLVEKLSSSGGKSKARPAIPRGVVCLGLLIPISNTLSVSSA